MTGTLPIPKLHQEYHTWKTELNFAKEEIGLFEQRLAGMAGNYYHMAVTAQVEHFQNCFIRHKEVIDQLKHDLHDAEYQLSLFVKEISGLGLDSIKMDNHGQLREQMHVFRKLYAELKQDFRKFEVQWY